MSRFIHIEHTVRNSENKLDIIKEELEINLDAIACLSKLQAPGKGVQHFMTYIGGQLIPIEKKTYEQLWEAVHGPTLQKTLQLLPGKAPLAD